MKPHTLPRELDVALASPLPDAMPRRPAHEVETELEEFVGFVARRGETETRVRRLTRPSTGHVAIDIRMFRRTARGFAATGAGIRVREGDVAALVALLLRATMGSTSAGSSLRDLEREQAAEEPRGA